MILLNLKSGVKELNNVDIRCTSKSKRFLRTIFYVDITTRPEHSLEQTLTIATELNQQRQQARFNQQALDEAAKAGFANGVFEDTEDEGFGSGRRVLSARNLKH